MARYRKNKLRFDTIQRFGQEVGLPLFRQENKSIPKHIQKRIEIAPKSIAVATDTKKLAHLAVTADEIKLAEKQQAVLEKMYEQENWSYQELAKALDWSVNRVIPRVFELRQFGLVIAGERRLCRITGMIVQTWRVK